jgi:hypothetical protein
MRAPARVPRQPPRRVEGGTLTTYENLYPHVLGVKGSQIQILSSRRHKRRSAARGPLQGRAHFYPTPYPNQLRNTSDRGALAPYGSSWSFCLPLAVRPRTTAVGAERAEPLTLRAGEVLAQDPPKGPNRAPRARVPV